MDFRTRVNQAVEPDSDETRVFDPDSDDPPQVLCGGSIVLVSIVGS